MQRECCRRQLSNRALHFIHARTSSEDSFGAGDCVAATLGQKADALTDKIEVDGKVLADRTEMLYYVMNKPEGVETTNVDRSAPPKAKMEKGGRGAHKKPISGVSDPSVPSVRDLLPTHLKGKIYPVGRLDKDSCGLLLFTNDGVLAFRLTHPKFDHDKEYEVMVDRPLLSSTCKKMEEGFEMDGSKTKPLKCWKTVSDRARVVLTEGKNRQVRRMFQQCGYTVKSLKRVRIMTLEDANLQSGKIRSLTLQEKAAILCSVGIEPSEKN